MGKIQGEGDYDAARKFNDSEAAFVKSGRVDEAARNAEPKSVREAEELAQAEEAGKRRSKAGKGVVSPHVARAGSPPLPDAEDLGSESQSGC
jgi:hypothetical protein